MEYFAGRSSVLCFSHDWSLLITRQWLLERIGVAVMSVMSEQELRDKLLLIPPDIIVLCQTLSSQECEEAVSVANEYSPSSRCVILCPHQSDLSSNQKELRPGDMSSPDTFLCCVRNLLADGDKGRFSGRSEHFC